MIFHENLSNHLHSMFYNKTGYLPCEDSFQTIIQNNPEVLEAVQRCVSLFFPYIKRKVEQIELIYITIHICAAIERKKNKDVAFHVVLACNGGVWNLPAAAGKIEKAF